MKKLFNHLYMFPFLITAFISFTACILVSQYTMKIFNITVELIQLLCALVSFIFISFLYIKKKEVLLYDFLLKALGCFILGQLYWVLHIYIKGYEQLGSFSISDLSWIGFYIFLLSIYSSAIPTGIEVSSKEFKKYSLIALLAPTLIITTSILLYFTGDDMFYTIIYFIPTSFLAYYSLKYTILPGKSSKLIQPFRNFNIVIGLIILLDNLSCLVTNFGYTDAEYIFKFCFAMLLLLLSSTCYEGVEKWSMQ